MCIDNHFEGIYVNKKTVNFIAVTLNGIVFNKQLSKQQEINKNDKTQEALFSVGLSQVFSF